MPPSDLPEVGDAQDILVTIPFSLLPDGQDWQVGEAYRVKAVLQMVGLSTDSADFEIVDMTNLDAPPPPVKKTITSDGGYLARK